MEQFERDTVLRFAHMNKQHRNVPYKPNSMDSRNEIMSNIMDVVEIKKEPIVRDEREVNMPMVNIHGLAMNFYIGRVNNGLNIGDLYSTHVKLEPKVEGETDNNVELKWKEISHSHGEDKSIENVGMEQQTNIGNAALKSSMGKRKKKAIKLEGKVEAVNNAAHRKQSAAKKSKKQYKCTHCEYIVAFPSILNRHMRTHTGEKPFSCNICTKRFTQKRNLQNHLKIHTGVKYLFGCSVCLKKFAQNDERSKHEATCSGRHYECHLCRKVTTTIKTQLEIHMRVHSGEKPFQCNICSKKFGYKMSLNRHLKIHSVR